MSKKNKKKNRSSAPKRQNAAIKPKAEQAAAIDAEAEQTSAADTVIEQAAIADSAANVPEEDTAKDTQVNEAVNESAAKKSSAKEKKQPAKKTAASKPVAVHAEHADNSHILKPAVSYAYILILFVLLIVVFILKIMGDKELAAANERNAQLTAAILAASENIAQLSAENAEQRKQLDAMSTAINARSELNETQKKEEEESAMPILYPIKGSAIVINPTNTNGEEDDNLMRFSMEAGSSVLASGSGLVEVLSDDGDGFVNIVIDHGNGYKSRYVGEGTALCEVGKDVKRGDLIMLFTENDSEFTYSVMKNSRSIDPMSVMVIDG